MKFEFATSNRILFGPGRSVEAGKLAAGLGGRALVTGSSDVSRAQFLLEAIQAAGMETSYFPVEGEPTVDAAEQGARQARSAGCDLVVGFGGGSALDMAKAVAALAANPGGPLDYLEVVGKGQPLRHDPLPVIAIPTTAGTGSEVTRNAVLGVPEKQVKVSLRSPKMLPCIALVDPDLTLSLPPDATASTGMDALTQLIEPFVSNQANPITDALCREGIGRSARFLLRAFEDGQDRLARENLALASLLGGMALANAKLGAVHGFAAPLGGTFPIPHGAACAALLAPVMRVNIQALEAREPGSPALERYREIAQILTGDPQAPPTAGADWVAELSRSLQIPHLAAYGVSPSDFDDLIEKASRASSMQGNPIQLNDAELETILARAV